MRFQSITHILGLLLIFLAVTMLLPIPFSLYYHDGGHFDFLITAGITLLIGFIAYRFTKIKAEVRAREGFAIVTLSWIAFSIFGCIPFLLSGHIGSITDAFFETMSGFTTTGATVLQDVEQLPYGLLFWRSLTHWLGGMGIIVLSLAILPFLGVGGMQLFKAEVPGPVPDKLTPRVTETAKILWVVYVAISGIEVILLLVGGMNLFESLCHTFGTMATGGFSTKNASIGQYGSAYIEYVITFFMLIAGTNFALHYRFLRGERKAYFTSNELRFFLGLIAGATVFIFGDILLRQAGGTEWAFRKSIFQVVAILTTTGYGTADYEQWSFTSQFLLFLFMFIGGCAGSTGGGMKVLRFYILIQMVRVEVKRLLHPSGVLPVRVGSTVVPREIVANIVGFFVLMIVLFITGVGVMTLLGLDLISAFGAVIASLGNIGPGLGSVGPTDNYAHIPALGKWILAFFMLVGRLEIYTVLVLFAPSFWRK